jgi:hypothetical protein
MITPNRPDLTRHSIRTSLQSSGGMKHVNNTLSISRMHVGASSSACPGKRGPFIPSPGNATPSGRTTAFYPRRFRWTSKTFYRILRFDPLFLKFETIRFGDRLLLFAVTDCYAKYSSKAFSPLAADRATLTSRSHAYFATIGAICETRLRNRSEEPSLRAKRA